jgi:hypothetical protein
VDSEIEKREMLAGLLEYMNTFEAGVQNTASMIRAGNIEDSRKNIVDIIDGLGWIVEGLSVLYEILKIDINDIEGILHKLTGSLENADDAMTADLFENGLLPIMSSWKEIMARVNSEKGESEDGVVEI